MTRLELLAPAKINLWLRILAREEGGYHTLESLFCALDLADELRLERIEGGGITFEVEGGIDTGPPDENLVVRAARAFRVAAGPEVGGVHIRLRKRIPSAAGLGGGSSDAAAALQGMNRLFGEPLGPAALLQLGIELGSDVPFFLCGSPLALGWGRGERLLALPPLPTAPVVVVHPGEALPTAEAFRRMAERRSVEGGYQPQAMRITPGDLSDWSSVARLAANDFEPVAVERVPRVGRALDLLRAAGARMTLLAGSGASVFGIFSEEESPRSMEDAQGRLREEGFSTWRCATLAMLPGDRSIAR